MSLTLRTDEALDAALTRLAEMEGTSRQEAIRRAVLDRVDRLTQERQLADSTARMLDRWGDVLHRLGTE